MKLTSQKCHLTTSEIHIDFKKKSVEINDPKKTTSAYRFIEFSMYSLGLFFIFSAYLFAAYGAASILINPNLVWALSIAQDSFDYTLFKWGYILTTIFSSTMVGYVLSLIFIEQFAPIFANITPALCRKLILIKEGPLNSKEIQIRTFRNFILNYEVSGDYADYLSNIDIIPIVEFAATNKKPVYRNWEAKFSFSKKPKEGKIEIRYA